MNFSNVTIQYKLLSKIDEKCEITGVLAVAAVIF